MTNRNLTDKVFILGQKIQEHYHLEEPPALAFHASEGWVEVPDGLELIEEYINKVDLRPAGSEWKDRARELLTKTKLTPQEDDELKHLHRKLFRETLGEGEL